MATIRRARWARPARRPREGDDEVEPRPNDDALAEGVMNVTAVVMDTIRLRRAYDCERDGLHEWKAVTPTEEQCQRCSIIATPEGKKSLARMAAGFHGYPMRQT